MTTEAVSYETLVGTFQAICRHCKKGIADHAADKCLFEATAWTPMSEEEWRAWRGSLLDELGKLGADFIREELNKPSLLERMRTGKKK